jgi:predicted transcriptional regulator
MNQAAKATRGSPKTTKEKVRLSLDISSELNDLLERLAEQSGSTKSEVLRKAIALMEVATEAKRQGKKFGIADRDQQLSTEIIGI